MDKKKITQFVVIICAFAGAVFVLYQGGIFGDNSQSGSMQSVYNVNGPTADSNQAVLPYGDKLDFSILDTTRFNYNQFEFDKLNPKTDVGISVDSLIVPVKSTDTNK